MVFAIEAVPLTIEPYFLFTGTTIIMIMFVFIFLDWLILVINELFWSHYHIFKCWGFVFMSFFTLLPSE